MISETSGLEGIAEAVDAAIHRPCVECMHHMAIKPKKRPVIHVCKLSTESVKYDPVTGQRFERFTSCYRVREDGAPCGLSAYLFEPLPNTGGEPRSPEQPTKP